MRSFVICLAFLFALVQSDDPNKPPTFQPETVSITASVRDFWGANSPGVCVSQDGSLCGHTGLNPSQQFDCLPTQCFVDFENYCCGLAVGALGPLGSRLDNESKPVLVQARYGNLFSSIENFHLWYRDTPGVNIPLNVALNFTNSEALPGIYSYSSSAFFPIDGKGFGNYWDNHNFAFTTEIKARFVYNGGEVFNFTGDDDLWVFIDSKLAVDIGGVHGASPGSVQVDTLGLVKGQNYPFNIFHAERHTSASNFNALTSIALYCPWFDWCGICQGTGQSCCTVNGKNICDDNNPCTADSCEVRNGTCINTPYTCPSDPDACTISYCDQTISPFVASTSCKLKTRNCDDGLGCTTDKCYPQSGCSSTPKLCDDHNDCTLNLCDNSTVDGCYFTNKTCNDGNHCTLDSCKIQGGCQFIPQVCDDGNFCTVDTCNNQTGCVFTAVPCDLCTAPNKAPCVTSDWCSPIQCNPADGRCIVAYNKTCDDGNACTVDSCNNGTCSFKPLVCAVDDACTVATCDSIKGCILTQFVDTCQDNNVCTSKSCRILTNGTAECHRDSIPCDDLDPCTVDSCDPIKGCFTTPVRCDDGDSCTTDYCNATSGACQSYITPLPQLGACNTSYCDPVLGIITSPVVCRPVDRCSCDPVKGCVCRDLNFFQSLTTTT